MSAEITFEKIPLRFSVSELDNLIVALLNNILNKNFYANVSKYTNIVNPSTYINDEEKAARIALIENIVNTVIANNIENKQVLLNTIDLSGKYYNKETEVLNNLYDLALSEKDTNRIDKKISIQLKLSVVENKANSLTDLMNEIKSESYKDLEDLENKLEKVEDETDLIGKSFKDYREAIDEANNTISLDDSQFLTVLGRLAEQKKNPSSKIKTGIQLFNKILDGGYQNGRVYCCLAPLKNWKSGFLLSSALWAKQYNHLVPKDQTKKPIVLYLTLENSVNETIERIIAHCMGNDYRLEEHTPQENAKILEASGIYTPNNKNDVGIEIMYKPNKSITVQDIKAIMDDFYKNGKEVVFLVIDYLKRIRPPFLNKDLRLNLGDITDELHVLALEKDIPVLTAMQLNRGAISELDTAETFEQKMSAIGRIGGSNVGESIDIIQNVDFAFTMIRTVDTKFSEEGVLEAVDKYLTFKVVATRYRTDDVSSFIQRFKPNNDMCLIEDVNDPVSSSIIGLNTLIKDKVSKEIKTRNVRHV